MSAVAWLVHVYPTVADVVNSVISVIYNIDHGAQQFNLHLWWSKSTMYTKTKFYQLSLPLWTLRIPAVYYFIVID
jgi:hypothetical protein